MQNSNNLCAFSFFPFFVFFCKVVNQCGGILLFFFRLVKLIDLSSMLFYTIYVQG